MNGLQQEQWESKLRTLSKTQEPQQQHELSQQVFPNLETTTVKEAIHKWNQWDASRRNARQKIAKLKKEFHEEIIENIGKPEGEENIWKAIKLLAPPKKGALNRLTSKHVTLQKTNGE